VVVESSDVSRAEYSLSDASPRAPGEAALWHGFNDFTLRIGSCGKDNLAVYFPSRDAACDLQHVGISPAHTRSNFFGRMSCARFDAAPFVLHKEESAQATGIRGSEASTASKCRRRHGPVDTLDDSLPCLLTK